MMNDLAAYLAAQRARCKLSLKDVYNRCGVTNSKLSLIERGKRVPRPDDLKKLAFLYEIDVIPLYVMAGFLDETDLQKYEYVFHEADLLDDEEKQGIQALISIMAKKKGGTRQ